MTRTKLPSAKDWRNRHIDDWNVTTFTEYLTDKHRELFGIDYVPMRSWRTEQGLLGNLIGTKSRTNPKPRTASNAQVKRFIDECMAKYQPTKQWPGINFGFMWSFRKLEWQRIQAEGLRKSKTEQAVEEGPTMSELEAWF